MTSSAKSSEGTRIHTLPIAIHSVHNSIQPEPSESLGAFLLGAGALGDGLPVVIRKAVLPFQIGTAAGNPTLPVLHALQAPLSTVKHNNLLETGRNTINPVWSIGRTECLLQPVTMLGSGHNAGGNAPFDLRTRKLKQRTSNDCDYSLD